MSATPGTAARDFLPDGDAARLTAERVSARLAESLRLICDALAARDDVPRELVESAASLGGQTLSSRAVAAYFDLLDAVLADDVGEAVRHLAVLRQAAAAPRPPFLQTWSELDEEAARHLTRHVNADATTRVVFAPPSGESYEAARTAVEEALALFDQAAPEISAEIRSIIREVIFVSGTVNEAERFDGATAFSTWGALFLNADEHPSRIEAVDGLSHESAHALLFGRSLGRPFVENPPDERYPSPLRSDPRPLDGIFHATFVSARMHYAHGRVLAAGVLDAAEASVSRERLASCATAFADGHATLRRHARLTPLGDALLSGAFAYMGTAAGGAAA